MIKIIKFSLVIMAMGVILSCSSTIDPNLDDVGSTTISISIPEATHVLIWLENPYKTKVKTIVDEHLESGSYSFSFEMTEKNGSPLPQGIYTIYLETDEHNYSRTMLYFFNEA